VNIPELRDAINRLSEFRTAEEVGLKLPKTDVYTIKVPMDEAAERVSPRLIALYRENIADRSAGARNAALGALMKLVQVSIHAELLTPPSKETAGRGATGIKSGTLVPRSSSAVATRS
jgi:hypothetical protein